MVYLQKGSTVATKASIGRLTAHCPMQDGRGRSSSKAQPAKAEAGPAQGARLAFTAEAILRWRTNLFFVDGTFLVEPELREVTF